MNILLVDDELDVVEGILDGIDFKALGVENVYTAQSAARAREIVEHRGVDVMVTDIEMPGGSGLDLLKWVRDQELDIVTLFCTSFAEFDYAKKAVELHSFDYFLKPIAYEALQERLLAAVRQARQNRSLHHYTANWESVAMENKKIFWRKLLLDAGTPAQAEQEGPETGVQYDDDGRFSLCVLSLEDGTETLSPWKKYGLRNVMEELFPKAGMALEAVLDLADGDWLCVLQQQEGDGKSLRTICEKLCALAEQHLSGWLNCFFLSDCPMAVMVRSYRRLQDCFHDDVCTRGGVVDARGYKKRAASYAPLQSRDWALLLSSQQAGQLISQLNAHLDRLAAQGELQMPYLKALRIDMMQMVYTVLNDRQINAHDLFSDQRFDALRENSLRSLDRMKRYLSYVVNTACDYLTFTEESQSVIGRVKEYINSHYGEEITRSGMAEIVFLNPDYLARLFKRETGLSLGAYVQERRIHEAKKMLSDTNMQVNEVALKAGYDNFSYFSHIFKERTGLTPNEYRKQTGTEDGKKGETS